MSTLQFPEQTGSFEEWVRQCFDELERGAFEDVAEAIADFTITGTLTELRTIDAGTATLAQLRSFVCTLVKDIKRQGQKRAYAG